jgi:murein DD-endopeptidase MepM/ murein hydrolase activator NlpD
MRVDRRQLLGSLAIAPAMSTLSARRSAIAARQSASSLAFSYPIGAPNRPPGEGFFIRHGFTTENTWYFPGHWHCGEDWYALAGDSAGASVYAVADGEVVYTGGNYPGLVVIVQHEPQLYSMYGHLDFAAPVAAGDAVRRGDPVGTVLARGDWVPNHLHFEVRTFLTNEIVNGSMPRYGFGCGVDCPPGPGYWPIDAPDLPTDVGWRNPTHVINARALPEDASAGWEVVVAPDPSAEIVPLWTEPEGEEGSRQTGELVLEPGDRFPLLEIATGPDATRETTAEAYRVWYRIQPPDGESAWLRAAVASTFETSTDGRPSSVIFDLFLAVDADA